MQSAHQLFFLNTTATAVPRAIHQPLPVLPLICIPLWFRILGALTPNLLLISFTLASGAYLQDAVNEFSTTLEAVPPARQATAVHTAAATQLLSQTAMLQRMRASVMRLVCKAVAGDQRSKRCPKSYANQKRYVPHLKAT